MGADFVTKAELALQLSLLRAEIKSDIDAFQAELFKWMIPIFGVQTIAILSALFAWTRAH
jgi:hypothetical protein